MTDIAIRVDNLSKLYHLGAVQQRHDTLRDALTGMFRRGHQSTNPQSTNSDDLWALRDISFEVKRGEVVGVIGRNGAGKSTLLKILSRITEPTSGRAETCGGRVGSLLDASQGYRLAWRPRADRPREHALCVNGATLGVGMHRHEIQRRFAEIVAFAEIERFLDTPVKAPRSVQRHAYGACAWPSLLPRTWSRRPVLSAVEGSCWWTRCCRWGTR